MRELLPCIYIYVHLPTLRSACKDTVPALYTLHTYLYIYTRLLHQARPPTHIPRPLAGRHLPIPMPIKLAIYTLQPASLLR